MQKLFSLLLAALLIAAAGPVCAQQSGGADKQYKSRVEELTGTNWLNSSEDTKIGILFGIEVACDVERAVHERMMKEHPMPPHEGKDKAGKAPRDGKGGPGMHRGPRPGMSPFLHAWYESFKGVPLKEIADKIDAWYRQHPDQKNRYVIEVVWVEIMKRPLRPERPERPDRPKK